MVLMASKPNIVLYGLIQDITFHQARLTLEDIYEQYENEIETLQIVPLVEFKWQELIENQKKQLRGESWNYSDNLAFFIDDQFIGGIGEVKSWVEQTFDYDNFRPLPLIEILAKEYYVKFLNEKSHSFVYMDIEYDDQELGRIIIELKDELLPRAVENFKALCVGDHEKNIDSAYELSYKNSLIHRIVPGGWIQGGDIHEGHGDGGESIYGPKFNDECFGIPHNEPGVVGLANNGPNSNQSQFYITLQPQSWMDRKYQAIGHVIEGWSVVQAITDVKCMNERPIEFLKIADCGEIKFSWAE